MIYLSILLLLIFVTLCHFKGSSESCQPNRNLFSAGAKLKEESMFKSNNQIKTTKSIPLFQPEYGFCQIDGSERGQTQDSYPIDKSRWYPFV